MTSFITDVVSALTVVGDIVFILCVMSLFVRVSVLDALRRTIAAHALSLAFLVALASVLGSLYYSEIAGFAPCKLCWIQRIFMYPQVILLGIALWKKDYGITLYSVVLSFLGALVALDHQILQTTGTSILPCSAEGVSCSQRFVMQYGYVTIPMMSLTAFLLMMVFFLLRRKEYAINKSLPA